MIRVINGLRYNTETAEQVYFWNNGHYEGDFKLRVKSLYRTPKGAWFLYHRGGAMTDMAVSVGGGGTGGSSDLEAISADDAYGFLEAHSDDSDAMEAIESFFPDRVVDA